RQGAQWGEHWAYIPPVQPPVPEVTAEANTGESTNSFFENDIDRFIYRDMAGIGLKPSDREQPGRLVRRLALDLTGLPPTPEMVHQIENGTLTYEDLVDQLLTEQSFGEKWATWWLD